MSQRIDTRSSLSRAYWCGHFSCSEFELMKAIQLTQSKEAGVVGLYLATRFSLDEGDFCAPGGSVCSVY